jgi:membrane protease YdiL (CAAX protease family)
MIDPAASRRPLLDVTPFAIFGQFARFLISPSLSARAANFDRDETVGFALLFAAKLGGTFLIITALTSYKAWAGIEREAVEQAIGSERWMIFLLAVIAGPIIEELLFRGPLTKQFWPLAIGLSIAGALASYFGIVAVLDLAGWPLMLRRILLLSVPMSLMAGIFWQLWRLRRDGNFETFAQKIMPGLFYATVIGFGLFHVSNYSGAFWLALPMALNPAFSALVYGYARVRWGMIAAIGLHMLNNGSAFLLDTVFGF